MFGVAGVRLGQAETDTEFGSVWSIFIILLLIREFGYGVDEDGAFLRDIDDMEIHLSEFIASLQISARRRDLGILVRDFFTSEGVAMMTYHGFYSDGVPRTPIIYGFPKQFADRYINEHLESIDPVLEHATRSLTPIFWSEVVRSPDLNDQNKTFLKDAMEYFTNDGIAFKVFGPSLRNAYVSLGFDTSATKPDGSKILKLQWVAQVAHIRFCELSDAAAPGKDRLTNREVQVLSWIAQGKSNSVIADLMGISVHTIDTHVRRIYAKLNVADRTSAALAAQRRGIVNEASWR